MDKNKTKLPKDWREARRLRAWELKQKGWKQQDIAEALGVSNGAVSQWMRKAEAGGVEALRSHKGGGPKPRLNQAQRGQVAALLAQGAEAFGFRGQVWTRSRVRAVIQRVFGITYSLTQVGRLLKQIEWSRQQPVERASQRDEAAIERWRTETWLEIEKKPARKDAPSCL
jgi:transposase